MKSIYYYIDTY